MQEKQQGNRKRPQEAVAQSGEPASAQQAGRRPPTMQTHMGLPSYGGEKILYSDGKGLLACRTRLFPRGEGGPEGVGDGDVVGGADRGDWVKTATSGKNQDEDSGRCSEVPDACEPGNAGLPQKIIQAHERMSTGSGEWQEAVLVDVLGWAKVRRHPTRRDRATPSLLIPKGMARGVRAQDRPLPLFSQAPSTERPRGPPPPPPGLVQEVARNLTSFGDCISEGARLRLRKALQLAEKDAKALQSGAPSVAHRQRARCGSRAAEVRIGPDEFHPTLNKVLHQGYTLDLTKGGRPRIRQLEKPQKQDWGINAEQLIKDAKEIQWPDQELLFFLEWGFMDYSGDTPPVCSYSPHQQKAMRNAPAFAAKVQEEIASGWIGPAAEYPPSIPFQVRPGSLEPKPRGRFRLVWNASWPAPGSRDSAVKIGGSWFPVAPNASTTLPSSLEFEWSAIETNNEAIAIMAEGAKAAGAAILGRTFDFTAWFRQLAVATLDRWKCAVHAEGGFREDVRLQMGRRSSAHSGQRTTFLLAALLQKAASDEQWGLRDPQSAATPEEAEQRRVLRTWLSSRNKARRATEGCHTGGQESLLYFSTFQDDVTAIALGHDAAKDASEGVVRILQERYGVPLSAKEEATREFDTGFTAIGATYDMADLGRIKCRPREEKLAKYQGMVEALEQGARLIPLLELQKFAGLHSFMARFLQGGEFYCNSAYCCLRAVPHTKAELRPVSQQLLQDAKIVLGMLREERLAPLTADPVFVHPGLQGLSADASGATGTSFAGWGVHVGGRIAKEAWPQDIKRAMALNQLSISPLELLAAAIALAVALQKPCRLPPGRQIVLRSDSESACAVVNSMRADSAPMLEALRIVKEVLDEAGIGIRLQYIPTGKNVIADNLSRGRIEAAREEARKQWCIEEAEPPKQTKKWYKRVLSAALQAARRGQDGETSACGENRATPAMPKRRKTGPM